MINVELMAPPLTTHCYGLQQFLAKRLLDNNTVGDQFTDEKTSGENLWGQVRVSDIFIPQLAWHQPVPKLSAAS